MILQQLYRDAARILGEGITPPMYDVKPVRWLIHIDSKGLAHQIQSLPGRRGDPRTIPYVGRTAGVRPILLADTVAYALGIADEDRRVAEKHIAFKQLVHRCATETSDPLAVVVDRFLASYKPEELTRPDGMADGDIALFMVDGSDTTISDKVRDFWARAARGVANNDDNTGHFQCLVTGKRGPVDKSLSGMIKGIPGGQSSGTALVSANAAAFESYGLERAETAPISRDAAETFTKALNFLIAGENSHLTIGKLVYVFWAHGVDTSGFLGCLREPDTGEVKQLLTSFRTGRQSAIEDDAPFYALALSASGGRAVVRDWLSTTIGNARRKLSGWFGAQEIVNSFGDVDRFYGVMPMAAGLYQGGYRDITPPTAQALVRSALHGDPLPLSLLQLAVNRNRSEQRITRNRAALIKADLVMNETDENKREEMSKSMTQLDTENTNRGYVCGRVLAILETVQYAAVGPVNTTLIDRYYGAASTTPAAVFGVLLSMANKAHLPKLRKNRRSAYEALQSRLSEVLSTPNFDQFPSTLTIRDQGLFALGYYHQRAADRAAIAAARERKKRGETGADTNMADVDIDDKEQTNE